MKIISWNVNGLRAAHGKNALDAVWEMAPDLLCLQEIKAQPDQLPPELLEIKDYQAVFFPAQRKGYSGVCLYTRLSPLNVINGIGDPLFDQEGRVQTAEFRDFFLVNCYVPNAQPELARLDYRLSFNRNLQEYMLGLEQKKPVILCGDLNVAHQPIDLTHPKANEKNPGYSPAERRAFSELLAAGYADIFRRLYPERVAYTWWSFRMQARQKNIGWRIDYFVASEILLDRVRDLRIHDQVFGSDHCPVELETEHGLC